MIQSLRSSQILSQTENNTKDKKNINNNQKHRKLNFKERNMRMNNKIYAATEVHNIDRYFRNME